MMLSRSARSERKGPAEIGRAGRANLEKAERTNGIVRVGYESEKRNPAGEEMVDVDGSEM